MSLKKNLCLSAPALLAMSAPVLAHSGHNHAHWSSPAVHAILAVALSATVAVGVYAWRQHQRTTAQRQQEEK